MAKYSVCVEMIFGEMDFLDRIDAVAKAGAPAFEFWEWRNKDIEAIKARAKKNKLRIASFVGSGGQSMVDASNKDNFVKSVEESIPIAKKLDTDALILTTGQELTDVPRARQHESIVACLQAIRPMAEAEGIVFVLEPLNTLVNHKGYYLDRSVESFEIIREIDSPNIKVLYDVYHMQIMEGNIIDTIKANIDLIGHFHIADVPGRHEPGTGELNYANIMKAIRKTGYPDYIGMEYSPTGASMDAVKSTLKL